MLTDTFTRENRYIVLKCSDLNQLSRPMDRPLSDVIQAAYRIRQDSGKAPLKCVVVESDWPEFEPTWSTIEARMTGRAIEAEVRAEAQELVAWFAFADSNGPVPLELWGVDLKACKNAVLENARSIEWKGTLEGYLLNMGWTIRPLYAAPQPPAPCPKCAEHIEYGTRNLRRRSVELAEVCAERDALQAKVAELEAEAAENCRIIGMSGEVEARHLARIAELEKVAQAYEDQVAAHNKTLDELARKVELIDEQKGTIRALNMALGGDGSTSTENLIDANEFDAGDKGLIALCREHAALIEKCEKALQQVGQSLAWLAFGECRSYGEGVPLLGVPDADALCKATLAAIAKHKKGTNL